MFFYQLPPATKKILRLVTQSCLSVNGLYSQFFNSEDIIKTEEKNHVFKKFVGSENSTERPESTYNCISLPLQLEIKRDIILQL